MRATPLVLVIVSLAVAWPSVAVIGQGGRGRGNVQVMTVTSGAPRAGVAHHYVFELYALDVALDVPAVGASPAETRAAVMAAMAGHVRGKGVYVGLFKRST